MPESSALEAQRHDTQGPRRHTSGAESSHASHGWREGLFGALGSAGACLATHPIDVARIRIQLACAGGGSTLGTLGQISRTEGVLALTRGMHTAIGFNMLFNGVRFSMFSALLHEPSNPLPPFGSGLLAGVVSGFISSPLALARTVQAAAPTSGGSGSGSGGGSGSSGGGGRPPTPTVRVRPALVRSPNAIHLGTLL